MSRNNYPNRKSSAGQAAFALVSMLSALVFGAPVLDGVSSLVAAKVSESASPAPQAQGLAKVIQSAVQAAQQPASRPAELPVRKPSSQADADGVIRIVIPPRPPVDYNHPDRVLSRRLIAEAEAYQEAKRHLEEQAMEQARIRKAEHQARLDAQRALLEARQAAEAQASQGE